MQAKEELINYPSIFDQLVCSKLFQNQKHILLLKVKLRKIEYKYLSLSKQGYSLNASILDLFSATSSLLSLGLILGLIFLNKQVDDALIQNLDFLISPNFLCTFGPLPLVSS
jgi:hypothetical protein